MASPKPNIERAFSLLCWLVDMCADTPFVPPTQKRATSPLRVQWLKRETPPTWLPVNASAVREPWLLAQAGLLDQTFMPALLKFGAKGSNLQSFPAFRLSDLGRRWARIVYEQARPVGDLDKTLRAMIEQALRRPADVAKIKVELVGHGLHMFPALRGMQGQDKLKKSEQAWSTAGLLDWAALCLVGKDVAPVTGISAARVSEFAELLRGLPT